MALAVASCGTLAPNRLNASCNASTAKPAMESISGALTTVRDDLAARNVFCNQRTQCTVQTIFDNISLNAGATSVKALGRGPAMLFRICLPKTAQNARLCEPYGEVWQQVGASVAAHNGLWHSASQSARCHDFSIDRIVKWWIHSRRPDASPFFGYPQTQRVLVKKEVFKKNVHADEVRGVGGAHRTRTRPPPLTAQERAKRERVHKAYEGEFVELLERTRTPIAVSSTRTSAAAFGTCAFVGSGHDLNCGGQPGFGAEIDAHDAVFRANAFQAAAREPASQQTQHSLSRFRVSPQRGGTRTTYRTNCFHGSKPLRSMAHKPETTTCIVSYNWWSSDWSRERFSDRKTFCCDRTEAGFSNYTMGHLRSAVDSGLPLLFYRGAKSWDHALDSMRLSSGGCSLLAAVSLCSDPVDVYGVGLFAASPFGEKVYTHAYDDEVGQCVAVAKAAQFTGKTEEMITKMRWVSKTAWRNQRVRGELLMHVLHALGIVHWRQ